MIELEELQVQMEHAYNRLSESTWKYRAQAMVVKGAEREYERQKLLLYAEGKIVGKNQTERDACEQQLLEEVIVSLNNLRDEEADLYMKLELNRIRVEHLRATLRIAELVYGQGVENEDNPKRKNENDMGVLE